MKQDKEAVEVWRRHFKKVLYEGGRSKVEGNGGGEEAGNGFELLNEAMTREEVEQALDRLKRWAAPDIDGLTLETVDSKVLVDFWVTLFRWCWRNGMVPSEWRSMVVPIPKRRQSGVCKTEEFRGISLVPVVYKAMCSVIQGRLEHVVVEKNLVAEEQGGFRKGRGCRDQLLTLVLQR